MTDAAEQINENEEFVEDAIDDKDIVPQIQYDITSYGADYDVEGLVKRLDRGDILIPPFQRNYVWKQREASRFVESLLLGLPVPSIFFAKEQDTNKLLVIDGQQRLKTLQFFFSGYFNTKEDDKKRTVFKLIEVHPRFEGRTYETLEESDRTRLNDSLIHAIIVKQESPQDGDTSIYHIFERLNSEGRQLAPQELRTAVYHGPFIELLKDLNKHPNWRTIYGKESIRLKDQELILRFLAFYYSRDNYLRPFEEFLSKFAASHKMIDESTKLSMSSLFHQTIDLIFDCIGKRAFRLGTAVNAAVFDSVMVTVAERISEIGLIDCEGLKLGYDALIKDDEYKEIVSKVTSIDTNVKKRFEIAKRLLGNV
jgi:hypothetical protein